MATPRRHNDERARPGRHGRGARLLLAAVAAAAAAGCSYGSETTATAPSQTKCRVELASSATSVGPDGGMTSVTITAAPECPWVASTGVSWLTDVSPASGQGSGAVQYRVAQNTQPSAREGELVINDARLRVSQAAPCRFTLQPGRLDVDASGDIRPVAVSASSECAWTIVSDAPWIGFTTSDSGRGDGLIGVRIAANAGTEARVGALTVGDQRTTVAQDGVSTPSCVYTVALVSAVSVPAAGGVNDVAVSTGPECAWTASSSVAWITVAAGAAGAGNGVVVFNVAANPGAARTGTVTIAGRTVTVTQSAAAATPCTYTIAPLAASIAAPGGIGTAAVSAASGCAWTAASAVAWIAVTGGASGAGNGSVAFSVAANAGALRSGTLTIAGQTFTVTQAAAALPCTYAIAPLDASLPNGGGTGTVAVSAAGGCAWTAASTVAWIAVTGGASGSGNGTVTFSVVANPGTARTGTITIAGRTFTVSQAAAPPVCTYAIAPTNATVAADGTSTDLAVTVSTAGGCAWTARSNDGWIDVRSGANGAGNGAVTVRVGRHNGRNDRVGTVTIGGRTFTVTQRGR